MISDYAFTYLSAAEEVTELFQSQTLKAPLSKQGVDWPLIPKRASWYGGFWERLIGLTKTTLKKVRGRSFLTFTTLQTIVVEIEAILNDRPLKHVSSNAHDKEPLTLPHLLYRKRITTLPHIRVDEDEIIYADYTQNGDAAVQRYLKRLVFSYNTYKTRWRHKFLKTSQSFRKKWSKSKRWWCCTSRKWGPKSATLFLIRLCYRLLPSSDACWQS